MEYAKNRLPTQNSNYQPFSFRSSKLGYLRGWLELVWFCFFDLCDLFFLIVANLKETICILFYLVYDFFSTGKMPPTGKHLVRILTHFQIKFIFKCNFSFNEICKQHNLLHATNPPCYVLYHLLYTNHIFYIPC